jgi:hypothetical protein
MYPQRRAMWREAESNVAGGGGRCVQRRREMWRKAGVMCPLEEINVTEAGGDVSSGGGRCVESRGRCVQRRRMM